MSNTCGINQKELSELLNEINGKKKKMSPKQIDDLKKGAANDIQKQNVKNGYETPKNIAKMSFKDFKILKLIGRGSFGQVCLLKY